MRSREEAIAELKELLLGWASAGWLEGEYGEGAPLDPHAEQAAREYVAWLCAEVRVAAEAWGHRLEGLEGVERFGVLGDKWLCACGAYVAQLVAGDEVLDSAWNPAALAPCPLRVG